MKITQCQHIINYMKQRGSISSMEAFYDLGITRLASRIHDLKGQGYNIVTETVTAKGKYNETVHFAVYRLKEEKEI